MKFPEQLFNLLCDGKSHSGETLAESMGVSRTAIWKQIKTLHEYGVSVEADRGKGYRLNDSVQLFDEQIINNGLSDFASKAVGKVMVERRVNSTNTLAASMLLEFNKQAPQQTKNFAVVADQQTQGRGRRGKEWVSPFGRSVYCSLAWRFEAGAAALSGLSLVVAVALVNMLEEMGYSGMQLKWPNDILWQQKKIAGILLEMTGDLAGPCDVVIGIGLNLNLSLLNDVSIDQPWADLQTMDASIAIDKNTIVAQLINHLAESLDLFGRDGFAPFKSAWAKRDAFAGKEVQLTAGTQQVVSGSYNKVASDGSVLIETAAGLQSFSGGELSLRAQPLAAD
jgi:BirA family biotin operon repressor/biotin-[acetyl-CoA-carboxylase] ligase